ncbi:hypothetical protein GBFDFA_03015 [Edwardsiella anguillarum]|nr:hypothetical protein PBOPBF_03020 [Edwardsiella anguillarum]BET83108.1 hypothetical protein GHNJMD_03320 [Edwardsiella anguillarum]BET86476.1 hypothetical protein GBFDFA_03015 [Edwardsiella anguillarum]BET89902.1 hypothetical protein BIKEJJ_03020 [Edwardsiella anguillarum]
MIEMPISQIRALEKPLRASFNAAAGFPGAVTPVRATSAIATTETAPIGSALPIMAAMVPTNSASSCQALALTPAGAGIINQRVRVIASAIRAGRGFNGVSLSIGCHPFIILLCGNPPTPRRPGAGRARCANADAVAEAPRWLYHINAATEYPVFPPQPTENRKKPAIDDRWPVKSTFTQKHSSMSERYPLSSADSICVI